MTRWLRAFQRGVTPLTEPTKLTEPVLVEIDVQVLSVKSVLSERELLPDDAKQSVDEIDVWKERAAIREYDGGQSREDAEWGATLDGLGTKVEH